jgi:hypothetical protein
MARTVSGIMRVVHQNAQVPPRVARGWTELAILTFRQNSLELILGHIRAVPPSAAKSLKQCGGVGITIALGLCEVDHGLLIGLFRA